VSISDSLEEERFLPAVTLIFVTVFASTYLAQLLIAGNLSRNAGIEAVRTVKNVVGTSSTILTWMFHSNHSHFLGNLLVFILSGWWVENRVDQKRFGLMIVFVLGIGANTVATMLLGTLGVGISGITAGLVTLVTLGHLEAVFDDDVRLIRSAMVFALSSVYILRTVGMLGPLPPGTAVDIHILGVAIGVMWYANEKFQYEFTYAAK